MKVLQNRDALAGGLFLGLGALGAILSFDYRIGSLFRPGPGAFPLALSLLLGAIGAGILLAALRREGTAVALPVLRPSLAVLVGIVLFGMAIEHAGLVVAIVLLVVVASLGQVRIRIGETLLLAAFLAALAVGIFVFGLNLPLDLWWM